jgi:hypothetical protein
MASASRRTSASRAARAWRWSAARHRPEQAFWRILRRACESDA